MAWNTQNGQQVPSVEEMRARLSGTYVPPPEPEVVPSLPQEPVVPRRDIHSAVNRAMEQKIRQLEILKKSRKLSPQEIRQGLDLLFQKYDFSPVEELVIAAMDPNIEGARKDKICMFLTEFMIPKLKSVEVSGTVQHAHVVVIRRFGERDVPLDQMKRIPGLPAAQKPPKEVSQDAKPTDALASVIDQEVVGD